ncbi:hypothetical protein [Thalassobaculum sp.]|uniref:hypothetical protein n=1 Tax=Thalassobaculum sp. TaxID=2022740 RepID=UPI0032EED7D0
MGADRIGTLIESIKATSGRRIRRDRNNERRSSMMMEGMWGMGWAMGLFWLLVLILLVLGIAALVKHLTSGRK